MSRRNTMTAECLMNHDAALKYLLPRTKPLYALHVHCTEDRVNNIVLERVGQRVLA